MTKNNKLSALVAFGGMIAATTLTTQAAITWAAGAPGGSSGGSAQFDGATFFDTGIAAAAVGGNRTDGGSDYSVAMWINSPGVNDKWFFGTGNEGIHLGIRNSAGGGTSQTLSQGHWGADSDGTTTILADTWYHATFTYDADGGGAGTGQQSIYLNGVLQSQTDNIAPNNSSTNLIVGARNNGANAWGGLLDDVAIWDSVISDGDIGSLAGGTAADTLGAGAYWDFEDDQNGMIAANSVTGGLNGADFTGIVPEPSSLALVLIGAAGFLRRKRA